VTATRPALAAQRSGTKPVILPRALAIASLMAGMGAVLVGLRITQLEEAWSFRAQMIVLLAACGSFATAGIGALIAGWFWRKLGWVLAVPSSFVLASMAFPASFAASFAIQNRFIAGQLESTFLSRHWFYEIVFSPASAVGLFLQTGTKYWLPWPAFTMAGVFTLAAAAAFRHSR
jgi:hypothetical protein